MRRLRPASAFLRNLLVPGLGYLYVGHPGLAAAIVTASVAIVALASWTRWILEARAVYVIFSVWLVLLLASVVHATVVAFVKKEAAARAYNRAWVSACWIGGVLGLSTFTVSQRAELLGYETFRIPSIAMSPTLSRGDVIVVDTWRYRDTAPAAGDIVVFELDAEPAVLYVKRVVGVPGDRIEIRAGTLYRNGERVPEPYLREAVDGDAFGRDADPVDVQPAELYVLGDFRGNSRDSRAFGPIRQDRLIGRVEYRVFALANWRIDWHRFPADLADGSNGADARESAPWSRWAERAARFAGRSRDSGR